MSRRRPPPAVIAPFDVIRLAASEPQDGARFGDRMKSAGDLDGDGAGDFWVAAYSYDVGANQPIRREAGLPHNQEASYQPKRHFRPEGQAQAHERLPRRSVRAISARRCGLEPGGPASRLLRYVWVRGRITVGTGRSPPASRIRDGSRASAPLWQLARRGLRREESKARTRARLIAAARKVFVSRGFHGASIEAIAQEAGYTIGALYSNFDGKSDLFLAVFEQYQAERAQEIRAAVAAAGAPGKRPADGAAQWMEKLAGEPGWFPLFMEFWSHAVRDEELRRRFAIPLGAVRVAIGRLVEQQAQELEIELPIPAEQIGTAIKALGNGIALEKIADPEAVSDDLLGAFLTVFLRGLQAGEGLGSAPGEGSSEGAG